MMTDMKCEPEQFQGKISSCQCTTTLYGKTREPRKLYCEFFDAFCQIMLENSRKDIVRFLGVDQTRSGTEVTFSGPMET